MVSARTQLISWVAIFGFYLGLAHFTGTNVALAFGFASIVLSRNIERVESEETASN